MNIIKKPFRYTFFNATFIIIGLNLGIFFLTMIFPQLFIYLGLSYPGLLCRFYWQPLTYFFVHDGLSHILFNMLALFFFGIPVERTLGSREFLLFYFLSGILVGLLSIALYRLIGYYRLFLVGASGAVYALLFAYAVIFPRNVIYIWGIIPVAAPLLVLIYAVIEIMSQISGGSGVAHLAHLSGLAVAWIYFIVRMGIHPLRVWKDAWR
ncbi:rhomboid family intramembrane serine protease [Treponema sp.]|uniref:rhomboid family intramembrane serine protease n=1 Tax=Treponema sp. TaxID=166 RepID=UPI003F0540A1